VVNPGKKWERFRVQVDPAKRLYSNGGLENLIPLSIFQTSNVVGLAEETVAPVPQGGIGKEDETVQYLLLIYDNEKRWSHGYDKAELEEYRAFGKEFAKSIKGGNALQPTGAAATVRVRNGKRLTTDGPFAETKEQLGGFYLVEARDRDEAVAIAAKIPGARFGSIEVRPIMTFS